ncbi:Rossmann fold domain-containing protein [Erythrobacter sp. EC-HK427]|uniref:Rossmann fold domain-containing protein n=1 Tax=Erythrobacter sp. EC-HK427 TaxID=2038396 RepID=UPI001253FA94|nr:hypothetical protein [Erythrobacter sp. EC-HK427]VVT11941.1 conserved hypothetical protein [Erythrobacter sp. EC-HK427]
MSAQRVMARGLPAKPLDAAAEFAARFLPKIRAALPADIVILFDPADHPHDSWRRAMVEELAREAVPGRVNAVVGMDVAAVEETVAFLERAPGVTGQVFTTNDAVTHDGTPVSR